MNPSYVQTVNLLLDIAPTVFQTPRFAMKGGTALNLFVQDLPRLSVDIDVVFIDHQVDRDNALKEIAQELQRIEGAITTMGYETRIRKMHGVDEVKLDIFSAEAEVKVEVNIVFRGKVLPIQKRSLSERTQALFSKNIQIPVLAPSELYGSKLVAAMDRQHPRDFFDVLKMYDSHGLTQEILDCFVVYLAGHNRPVHEVLFCNAQPIEETFKNEFVGMTSDPIHLDDLLQTQKRLMTELPQALSQNHRHFLLSLVEAKPDWSLLPFKHVQAMPAIQWKLQHLSHLKTKNPAKFRLQREALDQRFVEHHYASSTNRN
jgi:predicted nucleotidyltransferase component of viral defense system